MLVVVGAEIAAIDHDQREDDAEAAEQTDAGCEIHDATLGPWLRAFPQRSASSLKKHNERTVKAEAEIIPRLMQRSASNCDKPFVTMR
ncbi:hypothetical protein GCM10007884_19590 [Methylobacterium brachythecii]|uniref:Uncharacterized protein n=1 Tax=Methylobacterium brachythecii TaxID=1176177 RepID=A0ABQ6D6S2_9HYPH|nr:hypothetical protein GCM10007884_19590 [Methylobacterium brachythecii]